jgi:tripartite ATP-independent transporter DctM subunit
MNSGADRSALSPAIDPAVTNVEPPPAGEVRRHWVLRWLIHLENAVVVFALAAMVILPILEIILRKTASAGVSGSAAWVQHGSLIVGLIGAAIAAREDRLLSLATGTLFPKGWPQVIARIISAAVGATISIFLGLAGYEFITQEIPTGKEIAYGIPAWWPELALPIGFGLIALSILFHSADRWKLRWIAPLLTLGLVLFCAMTAIGPERLVIPAFVLLGVATFLGAPIFAILGGSALILFWAYGNSFATPIQRISSIALDHHSLVTNAALPTIPLFTLAGYFLAEGGASRRLVRVFTALFGSIRGGPAIVTALLCAFFTSFTGASGVTILALGGVLMPVLLAARYSQRSALGLLTGAGSLGMLFPPCLPLVLYAIISKVQIEAIFLGAIIPGCVLVIMTAILGVWMGRPSAQVGGDGSRAALPRFNFVEAIKSIWAAKWELLIPVVALVVLFAGIATPVEASAITAFYAFLTQTVFHWDLSFRKGVPHVLVECGLVIGGVLLILGVAQGFTNYLIFEQIPDQAIELLTRWVQSPYVFLLILNFFLLIVGGMMDVYPAIIVVAPLLVPIGEKFGIEPVHLGVIFLANLEMGFLMPPLGMNLLLSSYRFGRPLPEVYRAIIPVLIVQFIGVLLITYVPWLTTWLPSLVGP